MTDYETMTEDEVYDAIWPEMSGALEFISYAHCHHGSYDSAADIECDAIEALVEMVAGEGPRTAAEAVVMAYNLLRQIDHDEAEAEAGWDLVENPEGYDHDPADEDPVNRV